MQNTFKYGFCWLMLLVILWATQAFCQENKTQPAAGDPDSLAPLLTEAIMCEDIRDSRPHNAAVIFSLELGKVCCFTVFDPILEQTEVYHSWYKRDRLSTKIKLGLHPPRWATFSRIQFRESDKGPWRVEISDARGNLIKVLRFSITD